MQIVDMCVKTPSLYQQFWNSRLTENMRLTALQNDLNEEVQSDLFLYFHLAFGKGRVLCGEKRESPFLLELISIRKYAASAVLFLGALIGIV